MIAFTQIEHTSRYIYCSEKPELCWGTIENNYLFMAV